MEDSDHMYMIACLGFYVCTTYELYYFAVRISVVFENSYEKLFQRNQLKLIQLICVSCVLGPQIEPSSCLYINIFTVSIMLLCIFPCVGLVMFKVVLAQTIQGRT